MSVSTEHTRSKFEQKDTLLFIKQVVIILLIIILSIIHDKISYFALLLLVSRF